jgi:hypothetical protein
LKAAALVQAAATPRLEFNLLGNLQRIIKIDAKILHGIFNFAMTK